MNNLRDELSSILETLSRNGLLKHLLLIGSWALVVYETYFRDSTYRPGIRTTDVDFLIPMRHPRIDQKDIDQAEAVLTALRKRSDIELLITLFDQLTQKQRKTVLDSAKKRVFLDDLLKKLIPSVLNGKTKIE